MRTGKEDFYVVRYFPGIMIIAGYVLLAIGLVSLPVNWVASFIGLFFGFILVTTRHRLAVDFDAKKYHDYIWLLGFRVGNKERFDDLEYIFIKKTRVSQTMNHRIGSKTVHKEQYEGYLRFSEDHKLHLLGEDEKSDLMSRLKPIADKLQVKIVDYTGQ